MPRLVAGVESIPEQRHGTAKPVVQCLANPNCVRIIARNAREIVVSIETEYMKHSTCKVTGRQT